MSGEANVVAWLSKRGIECEESVVQSILAVAKASDHVLVEKEINDVLARTGAR